MAKSQGVWYTKHMTINQAPMNTRLTVRSFADHEVRDFSDIESRLMHLGFVHGEYIKITKKAPVFKEPLLVEVRGRSIALSFSEAEMICVEVTQ